MGRVAYAVQHRIAHVDVGRRHVDLRAQHMGAVGKLPGAHAVEQVEVFVHRTVAIGAVGSGFGQGAPGRPDLLGRQTADERLAPFDQLHGKFAEAFEIVRRIGRTGPRETEPGDVALNGVDVLLALPQRIGVVVAQVGAAVELFRDTEVQTDGLGMADVQVAVRLRREPRDDAFAVSRSEIIANAMADEVPKILGHGGQRWCTKRALYRQRNTRSRRYRRQQTRRAPKRSLLESPHAA